MEALRPLSERGQFRVPRPPNAWRRGVFITRYALDVDRALGPSRPTPVVGAKKGMTFVSARKFPKDYRPRPHRIGSFTHTYC